MGQALSLPALLVLRLLGMLQQRVYLHLKRRRTLRILPFALLQRPTLRLRGRVLFRLPPLAPLDIHIFEL